MPHRPSVPVAVADLLTTATVTHTHTFIHTHVAPLNCNLIVTLHRDSQLPDWLRHWIRVTQIPTIYACSIIFIIAP